MPRWMIALLIIWAPVSIAGGLWYTSETQTIKRAFHTENQQFNDITKARNIPALSKFLTDTLQDNATISLTVEHTMFGFKSNTVLFTQDFTKTDFIRFLELLLEPMASYTLITRIEALEPLEDGKYTVATTAFGNGQASEYMGGIDVPTLYSVQTRCTTTAAHKDGEIKIIRLQCHAGLGQRASPANAADAQAIMKRAIEGTAP